MTITHDGNATAEPLRCCRRNLLAAWLDAGAMNQAGAGRELSDKISAAINECERLLVVIEDGRRAEVAR